VQELTCQLKADAIDDASLAHAARRTHASSGDHLAGVEAATSRAIGISSSISRRLLPTNV
jgi:hypothetical protein